MYPNFGQPIQMQGPPMGYYQQPMQQPQQYVQQEPEPVQSIFDRQKSNGGGLGVNFSHMTGGGLALTPAIVTSEPTKKKRTRKTKAPNGVEIEVVDANDGGVIEPISFKEEFREPLQQIDLAIAQYDVIAAELKSDIDAVRSAKTMKGKYMYIGNLTSALNGTLANKVQAIDKKISAIKNANEMDYRREKDNKLIDSQNDEKAIMDMYNAFLNAPVNQNGNRYSALGPSTMQITSAMVPADGSSPQQSDIMGGMDDVGYRNYLLNMSPETRMMMFESDPNVQQVVVYDKANHNKYFQVMNMKTMQPVQGVPVRDNMFIDDCTIDLANKIARNINLNETYPLVVLNENAYSEY